VWRSAHSTVSSVSAFCSTIQCFMTSIMVCWASADAVYTGNCSPSAQVTRPQSDNLRYATAGSMTMPCATCPTGSRHLSGCLASPAVPPPHLSIHHSAERSHCVVSKQRSTAATDCTRSCYIQLSTNTA
jgi:hypothetical protein